MADTQKFLRSIYGDVSRSIGMNCHNGFTVTNRCRPGSNNNCSERGERSP